jgi:hypothetical protein
VQSPNVQGRNGRYRTLDDLEGPGALEHIATDQAPPQRLGFVSVAGLGKRDSATTSARPIS